MTFTHLASTDREVTAADSNVNLLFEAEKLLSNRLIGADVADDHESRIDGLVHDRKWGDGVWCVRWVCFCFGGESV